MWGVSYIIWQPYLDIISNIIPLPSLLALICFIIWQLYLSYITEPYISLVIKCNDFSKFIGNKFQITNLSDVTDFQKLIGNKCQSSFIFLRSFSSFGPIIHKRREGERVSFLLSVELARKLIFKVVISKRVICSRSHNKYKTKTYRNDKKCREVLQELFPKRI